MKSTFLFVLFLELVSCVSKPAPVKTGLEGKEMPNVNLLLSDSSKYFNTKNIPQGQTVVLFIFSPHCPYCRAEMANITENIDQLKNAHIYAMTSAGFQEFKGFYKEFNISQYPNITAAIDYSNSMGQYFKLTGIPFTAIYNSQKRLSKAFSGRVTAEQIKDAIESNE